MFVHLVSVGTSIIRNSLKALVRCMEFECEGLDVDIRKVLNKLEVCSHTVPGSREDIACLDMAEGWGDIHQALLWASLRDPFGASAELNAMRPWLLAGEKFVSHLILYPTLTGAGMLSGRVLARLLERLAPGVKVEVKPVEGFNNGVWRGLNSLARLVVQDLRMNMRAGNVVLFNATGGFKPEAGLLVSLGLIYAEGRSFAYYIHELHKETTVIPLVMMPSLRAAAELLAREMKAQAGRRWVSIDLGALGRGAEWLRLYALVLEPLGLGKLRDDRLMLDWEVADAIIASVP